MVSAAEPKHVWLIAKVAQLPITVCRKKTFCVSNHSPEVDAIATL